MSHPPSIRNLGPGDIAFALTQTQREGWDPTADLFETCLSHDPDGSFIAEVDGQRVGMITTTKHARTGWIGNLIVPPELRRQGLGERLMTHAMAHLSNHGVQTIRLEADPPGVQLYRRLGFVDEFQSLRYRLSPKLCGRRMTAEHVTSTDLPAIATFDASYFGDDRRRLLGLLFEQARAAYWLRAGGEMRGYAFVLPSTQGVRVGPWVATDDDAAETLWRVIHAEWSDEAILLGIPDVNHSATALLKSWGFTSTPSSLRMAYGPSNGVGRPERVFAIANGAMG